MLPQCLKQYIDHVIACHWLKIMINVPYESHHFLWVSSHHKKVRGPHFQPRFTTCGRARWGSKPKTYETSSWCADVDHGAGALVAKPMVATYGCYIWNISNIAAYQHIETHGYKIVRVSTCLFNGKVPPMVIRINQYWCTLPSSF